MRRLTALGAILLIASSSAWSGSLAGVDLADDVTVSDTRLQLNGMGLRKKLWVKVYVAGLYLEKTTGDAAAAMRTGETKRIVMHFLTNKATKSKMDVAWREGFEVNSPEIYPAISDRVERFIGFFGDMAEGDRIELTIVPGEGTTATFNGEPKGTVEGDDFALALLGVWLGDHPPSDDLKRGLLGG